MRTLTKTGIRILSAKYRSILIKCAIINASVFIGAFGAGSAMAVEPSAYTLTEVEETGNWNYYDIVDGVKTYYSITPLSTNTNHYTIAPEGTTDFTIRSNTGTDSYHVTVPGTASSELRGSLSGNVGSGTAQLLYFDQNNTDANIFDAGAITNLNDANNYDIYADFVSNHTATYGGAIRNGGDNSTTAKIYIINGDFVINQSGYNNSRGNGGPGGAIVNGVNSSNATIDIIQGNFIGNQAHKDSGGAIMNQHLIGTITGDFLANSANSSFGGVISNIGDDSVIDSINGNFVSNLVTTVDSNWPGVGGAIYNSGTINNINGDFILNMADKNAGAIKNARTINNINGDFILNSAMGDGGAIRNSIDEKDNVTVAVATIANITGNFIGNHAEDNGGAIYNTGTIGVVALNDNIVFNGNYVKTADGKGGAIYNNGTVGLYADTGHSITFVGGADDTTNNKYDIDGIYNGGVLNINGNGTDTYAGTVSLQNVDGTGTTNIYGGTVNALADIAQSATNVNNATLKLGIVGTGEDARAVNVSNLNLTNNAKLDTYNGHIDTTAINSINSTSTNPVNVKFDVDLANKTGDYNNSDTFNITTFVDGSKLGFAGGDVNFISDMDSAYGKIKLADKNIGTGAEIVNSNVADSQYKYLFKASNSDGSIDILRALKIGLREYVHNNVSDEFPAGRTYTMNEYEYIIETLGGFGTGATSLTVDGTSNHYGIIGNGFGGITVGNGKTLTIKNVGELNDDGSIKSSINSFMKSGGYGGFIIAQNGGIVNVENGVISSNTVSGNNAYGGAIFNMGNATNVTDSAFIDNQAVKDDSNGSGGAIYNYSNSTTNILAKGKDVIFRGNISGDGTSGAIYNAGTLGLYAKENKEIAFEGTKDGVVSSTADTIFNSGTININGTVDSNDYKGTINLVGVTGTGTTNIYGGRVNANGNITQNNINVQSGASLIINDEVNIMRAPVDLQNKGEVTFNGNGQTRIQLDNSGTANFNGRLDGMNSNILLTQNAGVMNFSTNAIDSTKNLSINTFAMNGGAVNIADGSVNTLHIRQLNLTRNTNFAIDADLAVENMDKISATGISGTGAINISDIRLLSDAGQDKVSLDLFADDTTKGLLADKVTGNLNGLTYSPIYKYDALYDATRGQVDFTRYNNGGYDDLNPAVMAGAVAAQVGGYLNQINSYENAFEHMDSYMMLSRNNRLGTSLAVKYITGAPRRAWLKPYAAFETVKLKHGPKVDNNMYGSFAGLDSAIVKLKHGWDIVYSGYASYDGSNQKYDGNSIYQNGGHLGATLSLYKGNFFTGLTANAGASSVKLSTMYGADDTTMFTTGAASKTGYDLELVQDWLIVQPSVLLSYSLVNMSDYTNASGVKISSDALHAIQIAPELKLISNLPHGWQPYIAGKSVWNMLDETKFSAAGIDLPELSTKQYVQYGIGIQKNMFNGFYGYAQAMFRNGGRDGVALNAGLKMAF